MKRVGHATLVGVLVFMVSFVFWVSSVGALVAMTGGEEGIGIFYAASVLAGITSLFLGFSFWRNARTNGGPYWEKIFRRY